MDENIISIKNEPNSKKIILEVESEKYPDLIEQVYMDTDRYLGDFLPYLDKGYTIFIVSDHGGIIPDEERAPLLGDPFGVNAKILYDLGYTGLKKDEDGKVTLEIENKGIFNRIAQKIFKNSNFKMICKEERVFLG